MSTSGHAATTVSIAPVLCAGYRDQDLNRGLRRRRADCGNRPCEVPGAAVVEIVAIDRSHDDMVEAQPGNSIADPRGLMRVEPVGPAGRDIAEAAGAGAHCAEDHHGGVLFPSSTRRYSGRPPLRTRCAGQVRASAAASHGIRATPVLDAIQGGLRGLGWSGRAAFLGMSKRCVGGRETHRLEVDGTTVGVKHGLVHRLRDRRCGKIVRNQLGFGRLEGLGDRVALDQLGDFGPDHVRAKQFPGLRVEHGLDHSLGLAEGNRLTVADKGKCPILTSYPALARRFLGQPDTGNLRPAIGAAGDVAHIERVHVIDPAMCSTQITPS